MIGAAHAGWKGALTGVIEATVAAMAALGAAPKRIRAALGPCIAQPSYEVGPEFVATFAAVDRSRGVSSPSAIPGERCSISTAISASASRAPASTVSRIAASTPMRTRTSFFSYRRATHRSEPDYGRLVSAIALA